MAKRRSLRSFFAAIAPVAALALAPASLGASPDDERAYRLALPARSGLGVWLLAGPLASASRVQANAVPGKGLVDGKPWRTLLRPSGSIDWAKELKLEPGRVQAAVFGNWLRNEKPFDGWLLLAADGIVRVAVDGRWIYTRTTAERARAVAPIPLLLEPGQHRLVIALERQNHRSSFSLELRERKGGNVPPYVDVVVPELPPLQRLLSQLVRVDWSLDVSQLPLSIEARLSAPAGAPRQRLAVSVDWRPPEQSHRIHWEAGTWAPSQQESFAVRLTPLARLSPGDRNLLTLTVAGATFTRTLSLKAGLLDLLNESVLLRQELKAASGSGDPFDALGATLEHLLEQTTRALFDGTPASLQKASAELGVFTSRIRNGRDPFQATGWVHAAIRSRYDTRPQSLLVQVPAQATSASTPLPLVVLLHGYDGSPRSVLEAFLDDVGPKARVPGIVLAPEAHGNSFYRGAGEQAVYDAIAWARRHYSIDPQRISITGVSMGGTGAAELAFRQSDTFAAAAPLCGYQSFYVRRDTANKPLRPWERLLMHTFSPASHADCGHDIPLYVAQGTKDPPLDNSRVLTRRYQELRQTLVEDWPDLGHSVWKKTYRDAGLFPWLVKWKKDLDPPFVSLTTALLRNGRKFWVELTELAPSTELSHLDARIEGSNRLTVRTRAVSGFCLHETRHVDSTGPLSLRIDGQSLELSPGKSRCVGFVEGRWAPRSTTPDTLRKAPYLEGPWSDLLAQPLVVVYGSQNEDTTAINRWVAERLFEAKAGVTLSVPVLSDREYAEAAPSQPRAVYVGRPEDHLQFGTIASRLPIHVTAKGIELGSTTYDGSDVGAVFVYPDPLRPGVLLGFVTGNGPEGLLRALSLPALVPDFVVFDRDLAPAALEPVLGSAAFVRAAGFFRSDWSLPADFTDPFAPKRSR